MKRFIGVDLHKKSFTVSFYDAKAKRHKLVRYKLREIHLFKRALSKEDVVGVEMTGNTRFFVEQIMGCVKEVKVVNPLQFVVIKR